jgi:exodeoxyribonuclease V alpha subunit
LLISLLDGLPVSAIEMAAPTGKAANRMAQSLAEELSKLVLIPELTTICEAFSKITPKTINRLLKTNPTTGQSAYSKRRPLSAKLIIVDETSMIDIGLMNKLIGGLGKDAQLVLVGDPNQLPSVETGSLLADLVAHPFGDISNANWQYLKSLYPSLSNSDEYAQTALIGDSSKGKGAVNKLIGTKRSSQQIDDFGKAILARNASEAVSLAQLDGRHLNAYLVNKDKAEEGVKSVQIVPYLEQKISTFESSKLAIEQIVAKCVVPNLNRLFTAQSPSEGFLALQQYAFLTPFRKSLFGTYSLNELIENELALRYSWVRPNNLYRCKPIMILKNDYQLSLFNGDIGIIWQNADKEMKAYFIIEKELKAYPVYNLPSFDTNYAMTIHKTQGSEFENVDILLPHIALEFLNKQLLYTGVTRAQKGVRVFTSEETFTASVNNSADRISGIELRLSEAFANADGDSAKP